MFLILVAGIWFGVQYLGYLEFLELGWVARRTVEQKEIIKNNLAFRRATERLARVQSFVDICETLETAFQGNDFDAFRLGIHTPADWSGEVGYRGSVGSCAYRTWQKNPRANALVGKWNLTEPRTSMERSQGFLSMYRVRDDQPLKPLMIDLNLVGYSFTTTLADALERIFVGSEQFSPPEQFVAAHQFKPAEQAV